MPRPQLKIVEPSATPPEREPEAEFPLLFAEEARLTRELAATRHAIYRARERYADKHRLQMLPSYHTLKRLFSA